MSDQIIQVDIHALEQLADTCRSIAVQLESLGSSVFDASEHVLGHRRLAGSLEDFHRSWSDRRGVLEEDLRAAGTVLDTVAVAFAEADEQLGAEQSG